MVQRIHLNLKTTLQILRTKLEEQKEKDLPSITFKAIESDVFDLIDRITPGEPASTELTQLSEEFVREIINCPLAQAEEPLTAEIKQKYFNEKSILELTCKIAMLGILAGIVDALALAKEKETTLQMRELLPTLSRLAEREDKVACFPLINLNITTWKKIAGDRRSWEKSQHLFERRADARKTQIEKEISYIQKWAKQPERKEVKLKEYQKHLKGLFLAAYGTSINKTLSYQLLKWIKSSPSTT